MARRATIADVATRAGVSITTVSHSLSGKGRVDPITRARVKQVADELGYVPNSAARQLAMGKSHTVGLLLPQLPNVDPEELLGLDWYGRVTIAASQSAVHHNRGLMVLPGLKSAAQVASLGLEGLMVLDPSMNDPRLDLLRGTTSRLVMLGRDPSGEFGPTVVSDTSGATRALLDHVWERGARRIGAIVPDLEWDFTKEATNSYLEWCQGRRIEPILGVGEVANIDNRAQIAEAARNRAIEMLRLPDRPDAILGMLEDFGRGVLQAARDLGLEVPRDLLVAQDIDGIAATACDPPLTAVDVNVRGQIDAAMELLLSPDPVPIDTVQTVSTKLVVRGSTTRPKPA